MRLGDCITGIDKVGTQYPDSFYEVHRLGRIAISFVKFNSDLGFRMKKLRLLQPAPAHINFCHINYEPIFY
jgi:hypothetical protein